jgi:hypothetical protein
MEKRGLDSPDDGEACHDGFTQITPAHRANSRVTVLPNQFIYLALMGLVAGIEEPLARVILALLDEKGTDAHRLLPAYQARASGGWVASTSGKRS